MSTKKIREIVEAYRRSVPINTVGRLELVQEALSEVLDIERASKVFDEAATSSGAGHPGLPEAMRIMRAIAKDAP